MRKSSYIFFNFICALSSAFFMFGSIWIWRGEWAEVRRENEMNKMVDTIKIEIKTETDDKNLEIRDLKLEIRESVNTSIDQSKTEKVRALPVRINLNVPFTSQAPEKDWSEPWQNLCEEAAILMLDAYYGRYNLSPLFAKDELLRIWEWEQKQGFGKSIEMEKVVRVVGEYFVGLKDSKIKRLPRVIENPTVEQIKKYIANGQPVLTVADGKVLPNPYFRNGGPVYHALIIRGYTEDKFITNDPGSGWSKNFAYKYDVLMNAIHDWNNGDVPNGRKVILVVE